MGGIVLTNDEGLWGRGVLFADAALPRANGPYEGLPYANYFLAPNYKINDLIAAVLLTQLKKVDGYIANKIRAAQQIIEGLVLISRRLRPSEFGTVTVIPIGFSVLRSIPTGSTAPPVSSQKR